jgi:hypothetical protein
MKKTNEQPCPNCSGKIWGMSFNVYHTIETCPKIESISYNTDGSIKNIQLKTYPLNELGGYAGYQ